MKKQWISAIIMTMIGGGIFAAFDSYQPQLPAIIILESESTEETLQSRTDSSESEEIGVAYTAEAEEIFEPEPGELNLAHFFPEGADKSDLSQSYGGRAFMELVTQEEEWMNRIYIYADMTPEQFASRLGQPRSRVLGSYNPKDDQQDPNNPDTWAIRSFRNIRTSVTNGDGSPISVYSNVIEIMSVANVYAYYKDAEDYDSFLSHAKSLWEKSHSYSVGMSDIYYCDGCLSEEDERARLEREAAAEEASRAAVLEDGEEKREENDEETGSSAQETMSRVITASEKHQETAGTETLGNAEQSESGGTSGSDGGSGSSEISESAGESGNVETSGSPVISVISEGTETSGTAGQSGSAETSGIVGQSGSEEISETAGQPGGTETSGTVGQSRDEEISGTAGQSGGIEISEAAGQPGSAELSESVGLFNAETSESTQIAGENGITAESDSKKAWNEKSSENEGNLDSEDYGVENQEASPSNTATRESQAEPGTENLGERCPGHIDLLVQMKIRGIKENRGLFQIDPLGNQKENYEENGWQGWTPETMEIAQTLASQDWYQKYGITVSSVSMRNPLTSYEIEEYLDRLPEGLSQTRRDIIQFALSSVGKVPYYWGGKPSAPNYSRNGFGALVSPDEKGRILRGLDCSGWINWVYWSVTGKRLPYESTSGLALCGTPVSRDHLQPGDIIIRTGEDAHVIMFLEWTEDGSIRCIHESSGNMNNVTVGIRDANWPYYRKLID